jgi:hypothetical protein
LILSGTATAEPLVSKDSIAAAACLGLAAAVVLNEIL